MGSKSFELLLPGGKVGKGQTLSQAANKELIEETGFKTQDLVNLGVFNILPAYTSLTTTGFLATKLTENKSLAGDEIEIESIQRISLKNSIEMIKKGKIRDARSVAIVLYANTFFQHHF